jgi:hypothetical protein
MYMKSLFAFLLFFLSSTLWAQSELNDSVFEPKLSGTIYEMQPGYTGSPFYYDRSLSGDILLWNGEWVRNKMLFYDGFRDVLIWQRPDDSLLVELEKPLIKSFMLKKPDGTTILFRHMNPRTGQIGDVSDVFMEVLTEGKASCYVYRKVKVRGYTNKSSEGKTVSLGNLVAQPHYYIVLPDKSIASFSKIRKRILVNALPHKYDKDLQDKLRVRHLWPRNENDLVKVVNLIGE